MHPFNVLRAYIYDAARFMREDYIGRKVYGSAMSASRWKIGGGYGGRLGWGFCNGCAYSGAGSRYNYFMLIFGDRCERLWL